MVRQTCAEQLTLEMMHSAVVAHNALKRGRVCDVFDRLVVGTESVVALKVAHRQIVNVYVVSSLDRLDSETDDLVVATHRRAFADVVGGDFVAGRDRHGSADFFLDDFGAGG